MRGSPAGIQRDSHLDEAPIANLPAIAVQDVRGGLGEGLRQPAGDELRPQATLLAAGGCCIGALDVRPETTALRSPVRPLCVEREFKGLLRAVAQYRKVHGIIRQRRKVELHPAFALGPALEALKMRCRLEQKVGALALGQCLDLSWPSSRMAAGFERVVTS